MGLKLYSDSFPVRRLQKKLHSEKTNIGKLMHNFILCFNYIKPTTYFPQLFLNYTQYFSNSIQYILMKNCSIFSENMCNTTWK